MSKYNPDKVNLKGVFSQVAFADDSFIEIKPKDPTRKSLSKSEDTVELILTLTKDSAKKLQDVIGNIETSSNYDNEHICPICGGQNDYKVVVCVNEHPCEIKTYCTDCGHEDYWAYGFYEPKDENGRFI